MRKPQPNQQVSQISDLYAYFVKHAFKKIALLKLTDKNTYQFVGCINKTKLLRWYNQPYGAKAPSFNSVAQKLLDKTSLVEFILTLENFLKEHPKHHFFSTLIIELDKKTKKFYFEKTLISDFLIRFKIISPSATYSAEGLDLKSYLELHAFPIIIVNRNREIIYLNQNATKIKKHLFPSKKINGIKTNKKTLFHYPLTQPLNGKLETSKMRGEYTMQSILHEGGLTFMLTFFKTIMKKNTIKR